MKALPQTAAVLGGGAVGQVLVAALAKAGIRVVLAWNRSEQRGWQDDLDITVCIHIGAGNPAPMASMETPVEAWIATMPIAVVVGASDWLQLKALHDNPNMRVAISEGSIGWVPYFMERADFSNWRHKAWTNSPFQDKKPSEIFKQHFLNCFIDDRFGTAAGTLPLSGPGKVVLHQ